MISRSNCANDSRMFSVSRPSEVVVLNCWVTETKVTERWSNWSTSLAKSSSDRLNRSLFQLSPLGCIDRTDFTRELKPDVHRLIPAREVLLIATEPELIGDQQTRPGAGEKLEGTILLIDSDR